MRNRHGRRSAGFTLAELLVTIGIIAILAAVILPNVISLRKALKVEELNTCARSIFTAVQNNLVGLKNNGTLSTLLAGARDVTDAVAPAASQLKCLTSADENITALLPLGAIQPTVAEHNYVVLFNPAAGTVYAVYYFEEDYKKENEPLSYMITHTLADTAARCEVSVGYYGGAGGGVVFEPAIDLPTPVLTIQNDDTLAVSVYVPLLDTQIGKVDLTITASSVDEMRSAVFTQLLVAPGKTEWVLDELGGVSFQRVATRYKPADSDRLLPGEQLVITARITCATDSGLKFQPSSATAEVNSLFDMRSGKQGEAAQVLITCARHLQNLNHATSGVEPGVQMAVLRENIDWPVALSFSPIENESLTSFDSGGFLITGLRKGEVPS